MDKNFVLRSGKYTGKTLEWLETNQKSYLTWIKENRPEMLKDAKKAPVAKVEVKKELKFRDKLIEAIRPNDEFDNEGPADISKPYLNRNQEKL